MSEHPFSRLSFGPRLFAAVVGVIAVIWAVRNLPWHLDDYDQAKQAYVSFEMVKEGHWWFQHTPTGRIATKPPLAGWISAGTWLGAKRTSWPLAWRIPSLVASIILLWVLSREGWRLDRWRGATLAAAAFGLNLMAPRLTTLVRTDMLLTLFISLAGLLIYGKLRSGKPWSTAERWQIFLVMLGSMLTKGPIAYAFLLPGLAAFWWLNRRKVEPVEAWSGWWSWFAPLLVFGAWAGAGMALSPEFYEQVVRREFLGRFTVGENAVHHNQPVYFYLLHMLRDFFPWSVCLIAMLAVRDVRARLRRDPALLWLVCWAVGGLIFMSLVPSKRGDRIFPIVPPLCLLAAALGGMLPSELRWRERRIANTVAIGGAMVTAAISAGGYAGYRAWESYKIHDEALVAFTGEVRRLVSPERLAVVGGKDEGMLLYLDRLHFAKWEEALELWRTGKVDGVVVPFDEARWPLAAFADGEEKAVSLVARDKSSRYVFLLRRL